MSEPVNSCVHTIQTPSAEEKHWVWLQFDPSYDLCQLSSQKHPNTPRVMARCDALGYNSYSEMVIISVQGYSSKGGYLAQNVMNN